ncbi:MAG TPA: DUF882 domain-containing protein [Azospirillaceae bacterium]|nr:DUF882 domain-containing protein [Azospirillaceae bacterium]
MTDETARTQPETAFARREFLQFGAAAFIFSALFEPGEALAGRLSTPREVTLYNLNTGERLKAEYWNKGRYQNDALREVNRLLRDHRTGSVHPIDPKLLDMLYALRSRVGARQPFTVISGYRSPVSNEALREEHSGVARNSLHMEGKAVDIRLPGYNLRGLQKAALRLKAGGVGFYPRSDFVHIDVGPVRHW